MSTHNICFYGELEKIISELSTEYRSLTSPLVLLLFIAAYRLAPVISTVVFLFVIF